MITDDPSFLPVGTPISAKFKGAFCEASVKAVTRTVKVKVNYKAAPWGTAWVDYDEIVAGPLGTKDMHDLVMAPVHGEEKKSKALIIQVRDHSVYTVLFDDGDERSLRRSQMCLKGKRHFNGSENLDTMPLTKPEDFYSPHVVTATSSSSPTGVPAADKKNKKGGRPIKKGKDAKDDDAVPETNGVAEEDSDRDTFVARWYKYREDCSQPANSTPQLGRGDVDLYNMYNTVKAMGGVTKVDNNNLWSQTLKNMSLPASQGVTVAMLRKCYKKYMSDFEHFVRHHGWNMAGNESHSPRLRTPSGRTRTVENSANDSSADERPTATSKGRARRKTSPSVLVKKSKQLADRERSSSSTPSIDRTSTTSAPKTTTVNNEMVTIVRVTQAVLRNGHRCWVGQKCRAKYKGTLYNARIQFVEAKVDEEKPDDTAAELPVHRVFVHYHGWKARFDEWLTDDDLDLSEAQTSEEAPPKLPKSTPSTSAVVEKPVIVKPSRAPPRQRASLPSPAHNGETTDDDKVSIGSTRSSGKQNRASLIVKEEETLKVDVKEEPVSKRSARGKREREPTVEMILPPPVTEKKRVRQSSVRSTRTTTSTVSDPIDIKPDVAPDPTPSTSTTPEEKVATSSSDDDEEENTKNAAPRVTRAKAAANPAEHLRKWSRQNPLLLEEEPRPTSSATIVEETVVTAVMTARRTPRTRKMTNESLASSTAMVEDVTIAVSATPEVDRRTETPQSRQDVVHPSTAKEDEPSTSPPAASSSPVSKGRGGARNGVKRRVSNLKNHKQAESEEDTPSKETILSPPKDTLNAMKAKVLQKLLEENYDFSANCEKVVALDSSLSDDERIEQLKRRMEKARRVHSSHRAKLLKIDKYVRNMAARNSSCTDDGEAKASPSSEGVSSSSPPISNGLPTI